jgi:hypothetical protein
MTALAEPTGNVTRIRGRGRDPNRKLVTRVTVRIHRTPSGELWSDVDVETLDQAH